MNLPGRSVTDARRVTEIDEGTLSTDRADLDIEVGSTSIGLTSSAKEVPALSRSIHVTGDQLTYTLLMGAVGVPLVQHLAATLHRQNG